MRTACVAVGLGLLGSLVSTGTPQLAARQTSTTDRVTVNDNRHAAGAPVDGVLTIRLEARVGEWWPDGDDQASVRARAFALEGGDLQVPGPLIRVPAGTEIRARVTNRAGTDPLAVHGLYARPPSTSEAPLVIGPGESRDVRFRLDQPGTYFYWAASAPDTPLQLRASDDTQLSGAIVVDPAGATPADRVFVIGYWHNGVPAGAGGVAHERYRYVINGRSWPATERLALQVGETARMRVLNVGANVHPMHLHGFYFNVLSRGDERGAVSLPSGPAPRMVVTERLEQGRTFTMEWTPTRPGNWLFHCHDNAHLDYGGHLGSPGAGPSAASDHHDAHAMSMAGPVMGITVAGASTEPPEPGDPRRTLRLTARVDAGGTAEEPAYGYTLDEGAGSASPAASLLPGPTILLKRGQPVAITVQNQLPEPTAVHWHGIELESYYDGVAGFAGQGTRVAPAIPPGGSFEARFTPPRSGTFIYHTHLDDTRQQRAGLAGPLLVVDDPATYDAEHDLVFIITVPRRVADNGAALINGSSRPAARTLRAGERYRLRFINAHTFRPSMRMRVLQGNALLRWRSAAKDGRDLPADEMREGPSEVQMGNGETYDFEFVPDAGGDLRLDVTTGGGVLLATMPFRVTSARP